MDFDREGSVLVVTWSRVEPVRYQELKESALHDGSRLAVSKDRRVLGVACSKWLLELVNQFGGAVP